MKTIETMFLPALMAALAAPAHAQEASLSAASTKVRFQVDADADAAVFLVGFDAVGDLRIDGARLLSGAILLLPARQEKIDRWAIDADVPADVFDELLWQPVMLDADGHLHVADIGAVGARYQVFDAAPPSADVDPAAGAAERKAKPIDTIDEIDTDVDPTAIRRDAVVIEPIGSDSDAQCVKSELPLDLRLQEFADTGTMQLTASFKAPSSDYGLRVVDAVSLDPDGSYADIYLYRKLPGPGEGLEDVTELHTASIELASMPQVRVFLAEGTTMYPAPCQAWSLVAVLR